MYGKQIVNEGERPLLFGLKLPVNFSHLVSMGF
jgi:hypothetical protein